MQSPLNEEEINATMQSNIETEKIEEFKKLFFELCEKYGIHAVAFGTRKEATIAGTTKTMCAGFYTAHIDDPTVHELKAISPLVEKAEQETKELLSQIAFAMLVERSNRKNEEAQNQENTTPFQDENGAK